MQIIIIMPILTGTLNWDFAHMSNAINLSSYHT